MGPVENALFGVVLGFSLAAPPGPMNAWIAARSTRSWRAGAITGLGAMTADALLGAAVFVLDGAVDLSAAVRYVYALGAAVMLLFAVRLLRRPAGGEEPAAGGRWTYLRALGLGVSNPFQVVWWLTAGVAFAYLGGAVLLLGLFGAIAVWVVSFPAAVRGGARRFPSFERIVRVASGAILLGFVGYFVTLFVLG